MNTQRRVGGDEEERTDEGVVEEEGGGGVKSFPGMRCGEVAVLSSSVSFHPSMILVS